MRVGAVVQNIRASFNSINALVNSGEGFFEICKSRNIERGASRKRPSLLLQQSLGKGRTRQPSISIGLIFGSGRLLFLLGLLKLGEQ